MDLVGAESRRGGTRGGRAQFSWDDVNPEERSYYLGNSTVQTAQQGASGSRRGASAPRDWYARAPPAQHAPSQAEAGPLSGRISEGQKEIEAVRRREQAMLDAAVGGRSFSEAVRAALAESVASGVDDEPDSAAEVAKASAESKLRKSSAPESLSREERAEKAKRKEFRARKREERRLRRARRRDSSESERESLRSRQYQEHDRRRRRRERESDREEENRRSTRRPRSEDDAEDTGDSESVRRARRRQRHR